MYIIYFDYLKLVRELAAQGVIRETQRYEFEFSTVEKPYESYRFKLQFLEFL